MNKPILGSALFFLMLFAVLPLQAQVYVIENVTIVPVTSPEIAKGHLVIENGIIRDFGRQHFDRHIAADSTVEGAENDSHTAPGNLLTQFVPWFRTANLWNASVLRRSREHGVRIFVGEKAKYFAS